MAVKKLKMGACYSCNQCGKCTKYLDEMQGKCMMCHAEVPEGSLRCPQCGAPLPPPPGMTEAEAIAEGVAHA